VASNDRAVGGCYLYLVSILIKASALHQSYNHSNLTEINQMKAVTLTAALLSLLVAYHHDARANPDFDAEMQRIQQQDYQMQQQRQVQALEQIQRTLQQQEASRSLEQATQEYYDRYPGTNPYSSSILPHAPGTIGE
jgi:hypothetical protein